MFHSIKKSFSIDLLLDKNFNSGNPPLSSSHGPCLTLSAFTS